MSHPNFASEDWRQEDGLEVTADAVALPMDPYLDGTSTSRKPSRRIWMGIGAVILLGIGGVIVALTAGGRTSSQPVGAAEGPVAAPTVFDDGTPGPTPASAPQILDLLVDVARQGGTEFLDSNSYQARALDWVMTQELPVPDLNLSRDEQAIQLYALACIYYNIFSARNTWTDIHYGEGKGVPGWFRSDGWLGNASEMCSWFGITCDGDGRVAKLELPKNGLTGYLPPETAYLASSLQTLELFSNFVHNKGDEGNSFLGELTELRQLLLSRTSFEYDGIPSEIGKLTNLEELDVSYTLYYGDITEGMWGQLSNLDFLVIEGNEYTSALPADLIALPNLKFLYAGSCGLQGDLEFISQMPIIEEVWIDDNPNFAGTIPVSLTTQLSLEGFSATGCGLTGTLPTEFGFMDDLIQLWLYDNDLVGSIPTELGRLRKLKTLNLQKNRLTGEMPSQICDRKYPFGRLNELEADCDGEIACEEGCCTCCGEQCIDDPQ